MSSPANYTPLEQVTRPTVPTADAAHYLNRQPQTMRACRVGQFRYAAESTRCGIRQSRKRSKDFLDLLAPAVPSVNA